MLSVAITILAAMVHGGPPSSPPPPDLDRPQYHEVHVAYGDVSISGAVAVLRIRMFADDLALALGRRAGAGTPEHGPSMTEAFLEYFQEQFLLEADGRPMAPHVVGSGQDRVGSEPVVWYIVRFDSDRDIRSLRIVNRVLFDLFDDQRNMVNVVDEPSGRRRVFYLTPDQDTARFDLPATSP